MSGSRQRGRSPRIDLGPYNSVISIPAVEGLPIRVSHLKLTARECLLVVALFTLATLVLTLPVAVHPTRTLPSDLVATLLNTWILGWDADRLRHGLVAVWDAPIFYPYRGTLAFSENLFGLAFFVAPVYWLSGNAVLTYNAGFLLSFVVAGTGMYLLTRALTNNRRAAVLAGTFYAFCPLRMAQISHVQMVATGWIPVTLWRLHEYLESGAWPWLIAFATGWILQTLSNSYAGYFLCVPIAFVAVDGLVRRRDRGRTALQLLLAGCAVVIFLAPVVAAYYRARVDYQQVRGIEEMAAGAADVRSYLVGKDTIGIWRWLPTAVGIDPECELFPGVVALVLAAYAVWRTGFGRGEPSRYIRLYAAIGLAAGVLSLGPRVRIWGRQVLDHGPYEWMLRIVPWMDGMRVPARFAIIVFVALSVLVGYGGLLVLERLGPRRRVWGTLVCLAVLVSESWAVPLHIEHYSGHGRPADRAVAAWLGRMPAGAVLHLPITTDHVEELSHQYATLFHHHPIVNGFSGYSVPVQDLLRAYYSPLKDYERFDATLRMTRSIGVRYVVVDPDGYRRAGEPDEATHVLSAMRASDQVIREERVSEAVGFELAPWPPVDPEPAVLVPVDPRELTPSASENLERVGFALDGDPDSRWIAGIGGQDGSSWFAVQLARPSNIARVELQLAERSMMDYPPHLEIESTDEGGRTRTLYRASPYPELAAAILRNGRYSALQLDVPANETVTLRVRQTSATRRSWSIHELRLWRR